MIMGIGIDVVQVKRMEKWLKNSKLLERYFHDEELSTALSRGNAAAMALAARFAAKEAFGKALGTGFSQMELKDIMVINTSSGRPEIRVLETAKKALEESGADKVHVSLTHESDNAIAVVILERM